MSSQLANPGTEILDEIMHLVFEEQKASPYVPDRHPVAIVPEARISEFYAALRCSCVGLPVTASHASEVYWHGVRIIFSMNAQELMVRL